jgi:hypothetical protein
LHPTRLTMCFGAIIRGSVPVVETDNFAPRLVNLKFDTL